MWFHYEYWNLAMVTILDECNALIACPGFALHFVEFAFIRCLTFELGFVFSKSKCGFQIHWRNLNCQYTHLGNIGTVNVFMGQIGLRLLK